TIPPGLRRVTAGRSTSRAWTWTGSWTEDRSRPYAAAGAGRAGPAPGPGPRRRGALAPLPDRGTGPPGRGPPAGRLRRARDRAGCPGPHRAAAAALAGRRPHLGSLRVAAGRGP